MKIKWICWTLVAAGALLILLTGIGYVFNISVFGVGHILNLIPVADSLLILAIALFITTRKCCEK